MKLEQSFQSPRVLLTLFTCLMATCALALGWLGWQVVVQDRALEEQRRQQKLEGAADRTVAATERGFAAADAEVIVKANGEIEIMPAGRLAYAPAESPPATIPAQIFSEAEELEFLNHDLANAAQMYVRLAESGNAQIRAEALVRLGGALRRQKKWADSLRAYDSLQRLDHTPVVGMPASLVARAARSSILVESGDLGRARLETERLWADLVSGKWSITKATLETYLKELQAVVPELALPEDWEERRILADASRWAFEQQTAAGRAARTIDGQVVWVSWERQGDTWKARLVGPSTWQRLWKRLEHDTGITLRVVDADRHVVYDSGSTNGPSVFLPPAKTGLPWSLTATSIADDAISGYQTARQRFLIAGLVLFAAVFGLGSFFIARAVSREFAVARLQSDFVAAVSHEFRTPLTSIRQLAEMLARGRVESEPDKNRAYELILGQSDRLRRLVESLLDFGRMQARQFKFRSESIEATECFRSAAEEFQETVRSRGYSANSRGPNGLP